MNKPIIYHCNRCKYYWSGRNRHPLQPPKYCPRCKSPYWNKKRLRPIKK